MARRSVLSRCRLFRPFCPDKLLAAIPATAKKIAVLDRTKEPGAQGEPLYLDVVTALANAGKTDVTVIGGRYGLGSKDTPPASVFAVYNELKKADNRSASSPSASSTMSPTCPSPKSPLPTPRQKAPSSASSGVSAATALSVRTRTPSRSSATIPISTFRLTSSTTPRRPAVSPSRHLRFGDKPIKSPYYINKADFVACHNPVLHHQGLPDSA